MGLDITDRFVVVGVKVKISKFSSKSSNFSQVFSVDRFATTEVIHVHTTTNVLFGKNIEILAVHVVCRSV